MTISKRSTFKGPRLFMGGRLSAHTAGGILELCRELNKNKLAVIELLAEEALMRRHPEWYTHGYKHPLEYELEALEAEELAQREAELLAAERDATRAA